MMIAMMIAMTIAMTTGMASGMLRQLFLHAQTGLAVDRD